MSGSPPVPDSFQESIYERVVALERASVAFVLVTLVESLGSTPQDTGAKLIVTSAGIDSGTVGGGKVEAAALSLARELLAEASAKPRFVTWTLKGDVGMTCGGSVKFYLEPHPAGGSDWTIAVFGAGHVVQALLPVLIPLPARIVVIDPRAEWLDRLPRARNVRILQSAAPQSLVPTLPKDAFVLCMTQGHQSDRPILEEALRHHAFPYIGVIGSQAKASILRSELAQSGINPQRAAQFHCPVGLDFGTNHPHEIALSIAAQLLAERDRLRA